MSRTFQFWLGITLLLCTSANQVGNQTQFDEQDILPFSKTEPFAECKSTSSAPTDRRRDQTRLRVATFNVEWLYVKNLGPLDCPGATCKWHTVQDALDHIQAVAEVIKKMDVDILELNEVEDCRALELLITAIGDDTYQPFIVQGTDTNTAQNVAFITRVDPTTDVFRSTQEVPYPVKDSQCGYWNGKQSSTDMGKNIVARFDVNGFSNPITVIGLHFRSRPTQRVRCFEREGQATVISNLVNAASVDSDVIVLGDFNDFDDKVKDIKDSYSKSQVHRIVRESGDGLENVSGLVPKRQRYTNWWNKKKDGIYKVLETSQLDYIYVSQNLYQRLNKDLVDMNHHYFK